MFWMHSLFAKSCENLTIIVIFNDNRDSNNLVQSGLRFTAGTMENQRSTYWNFDHKRSTKVKSLKCILIRKNVQVQSAITRAHLDT